MKRNLLLAGVLGSALLMGALDCQAATWVKNNVDIPNKNADSNFYDSDSVKAHAGTLSWTEKFVLTSFGAANYTKHLAKYPACQANIAAKGEVTQHQLDFQIRQGKYRVVAKRNYNKNNELICSDTDMGDELDKSWQDVVHHSPMSERYYILVTKFHLGDV